jgi:hypothetical protein
MNLPGLALLDGDHISEDTPGVASVHQEHAAESAGVPGMAILL